MRLGPALAALLSLAACGGGGGGNSPPPPAPANQAPSFTSGATASVTENVQDAYQATATDPEGSTLSFTISGGADASRFTISPGGSLRFAAAPDFEAPGDADGDNAYLVQLTVSDGQLTATTSVRIEVTNSREGIQVRRVASGFSQPLYVAPIPGDSRILVLQKEGAILIVDPATGSKVPFMTVSDISTEGERGLLGLAPSPDYQSSGLFYVYVTNPSGDLEIRRYRRGGDGRGDPQSAVLILRIPHREFTNHNGGWLGFGPDGHLYIATGDGGGSGDPLNNAQNTNSLLGKILRIAINPDPFAGASPVYYLIPPDNPFANGGGAGEVFAYGLRNPFRASFFAGGLLIGDVGQGAVEEVDLLRPQDGGANFGWPFREGTRPFRDAAPGGLTEPVTQYFHGTGPREGRTVTGGYVYRGPAQSLAGHYVFADFIVGNIWTVPVSLLQPGQVLPASRYQRRNEDFTPDFGSIDQPVSFGEDSAGNLYIVDFDGEVFIVGAS